MLQSMHSQLFVVLLYPLAGSGCCRISCRYSLVLRKCRVLMVPAPNICLYNTYSLVYKLHLKHECQYNTYLIRVMPRVIAISGPIKPTGEGSCRISHWFPRVWPVPDSMPVPIGRAWLVPDSIPAPIAPPDNPGY